MAERALLRVKEVCERFPSADKTRMIDFRLSLRSFHDVRHVRVLSFPFRDRTCDSETLLRRVFLRVLDKDKRPRTSELPSVCSMIKGLLDNRFQVKMIR